MTTVPCREHRPPNRAAGEKRDERLTAEDWFLDPRAGQLTEDGKRRRRALDACWECPVRLLCLDEGLEERNLSWGIWGGYTEEQRQEIHNVREARRAAEVKG